jgi:hypothetical protein
MNDRDRFQIRRCIDAKECGLALDDMADIVLEIDKAAAPELRRLFDAAADKTNIEPGDGWGGLDSLRTSS